MRCVSIRIRMRRRQLIAGPVRARQLLHRQRRCVHWLQPGVVSGRSRCLLVQAMPVWAVLPCSSGIVTRVCAGHVQRSRRIERVRCLRGGNVPSARWGDELRSLPHWLLLRSQHECPRRLRRWLLPQSDGRHHSGRMRALPCGARVRFGRVGPKHLRGGHLRRDGRTGRLLALPSGIVPSSRGRHCLRHLPARLVLLRGRQRRAALRRWQLPE